VILSCINAIILGTLLDGSFSRILADTRDGYTGVDSMFSLPLTPSFDGDYLPLTDEDLYESVGDVLLDADTVVLYICLSSD
jgi:hypothetical protein